MKRSEMLQKMVKVLEETKALPIMVQAKSLLAMQMEARMRPPMQSNEWPTIGNVEDNISWMIWETEDETK